MNKEEIAAKIIEMQALQSRLNPIIARFLERTIDQHGEEAGLSVASYIATNMLAFCMLVIEDMGGDADPFMHLILKELAIKHSEGRANADALHAIHRASAMSQYTCRPRH